MAMKQVWGAVVITMLLVLGLSPLWVTGTSDPLPALQASEIDLGLPLNRPNWDLTDTLDSTRLVIPDCAADEGNEFVISGRGGVPSHPKNLLRGTALWVDRPSEDLLEVRSEFGPVEELTLPERAQMWRHQAQTYDRAGDRLGESLALTALSLVKQELGQWLEAIAVSEEALQHLPNSPQRTDEALAWAMALNSKGRADFLRGQPLKALETWHAAQQAYDIAAVEQGRLGSTLNQIQALQTLGRYPLAYDALASVLRELQALPPSELTVQAYSQLGDVLQLMGEEEQSQTTLEQGLTIAQELGDRFLMAQLEFRLANGYRDQQQLDRAIVGYERAIAAVKPESDLALEARLNLLNVLVLRKDLSAAEGQMSALEAALEERPPSRRTSYGRINFSESLRQWDAAYRGLAAQQLSQAVEDARHLQDARAQSYALGQLGQIYETAEEWDAAKELTQQALSLAEELDGRDLRALWQWQLGRILDALGQRSAAIALYRDTVELLDVLRLDLVSLDPELQFSYRQQIEPVYQGLVRLLLEAATEVDTASQQAYFQEAQATLISLRLSELDNFFRETCLTAEAIELEQLDESAAVFYTALLRDRLAVIVSIAGEPPFVYDTRQPRSQLEESLALMLQSISPAIAEEERLEQSAQVYDWLIRPVQELLQEHQIKTLVFIPDGSLRNIPLAALYDRTSGEYLIEQYAISLTQSLQLLETGSLGQGEFNVLLGGVSEAHQGFLAIPAVELEITEIADLLPRSQSLLNQEFTREALVAQSRNADVNVIHLATHGQFSSRVEETFLLTWEGRINVKDLDVVLRSPTRPNPIDLLVLSACQTATGDDRATLGIAGFALRSGARSTLATLWSVQDAPTAELMVQFYQQLWQNSGQKKAESLRQAQLALLHSQDYNHPAYWSPFVLVGNWL